MVHTANHKSLCLTGTVGASAGKKGPDGIWQTLYLIFIRKNQQSALESF